jgi:hypothetical protein
MEFTSIHPHPHCIQPAISFSCYPNSIDRERERDGRTQEEQEASPDEDEQLQHPGGAPLLRRPGPPPREISGALPMRLPFLARRHRGSSFRPPPPRACLTCRRRPARRASSASTHRPWRRSSSMTYRGGRGSVCDHAPHPPHALRRHGRDRHEDGEGRRL